MLKTKEGHDIYQLDDIEAKGVMLMACLDSFSPEPDNIRESNSVAELISYFNGTNLKDISHNCFIQAKEIDVRWDLKGQPIIDSDSWVQCPQCNGWTPEPIAFQTALYQIDDEPVIAMNAACHLCGIPYCGDDYE